MPDPVVITRPAAQAAALADSVVALGREAVLLPLLEILPLADQSGLQRVLADVADYALVAFVSPNAIDAAFAHLRGWPAGVALAVLGESSKAALAEHGVDDSNATIFSPLDPARSDSEHLLQALDLAALAGRRVPALTPQLADTLRGLLARQNDWIITSSEALRGLLALVAQLDGGAAVAKMQQQHLIVPHARIAETAATLGLTRLTLAGSGDASLLAALQSRA
jgi:uroporphyrinogen-III synthase